MSNKVASPTATVLRHSRLFSMPPPLQRPGKDLFGHERIHKISDSATLPYPVQQAVTVPPSSRSRGDWGFKRALPLRSTIKSSTPSLRVNAVDTREHITDYESGADLTLSRRKFEELNMPITGDLPRGSRGGGAAKGKSVFEPYTDNTDPEVTAEDPNKIRWKFKGPWVTGLNPGDFEAFLDKRIRGRTLEFLEFVRKHRAKQLERDYRKDARLASQSGVEMEQKDVSVSDEDLSEYIRSLRSDYVLNSPLSQLVRDFLDLPPIDYEGGNRLTSAIELQSTKPPATHPSAGASYLRTNAYLENHPILGPQRFHSPVESRVLSAQSPSSFAGGSSYHGKLGIAGMVVDGTNPSQRKRAGPGEVDRIRRIDELRSLGLKTPGGNKVWTEPFASKVDDTGRIILSASNADGVAVGVKTGELAAPTSAPPRVDMAPSRPVSLNPFDRIASSRAYGFQAPSAPSGSSGPSGPSGRPDGTARMVDMLRKDAD